MICFVFLQIYSILSFQESRWTVITPKGPDTPRRFRPSIDVDRCLAVDAHPVALLRLVCPSPWLAVQLSESVHEKRNRSEVRKLTIRHTLVMCRSRQNIFLLSNTRHLNNPRKFWKAIKSLSTGEIRNELPPCLTTASGSISDRVTMFNGFNEHFVSCGFLFDSVSNSAGKQNLQFFSFYCGSRSFTSFVYMITRKQLEYSLRFNIYKKHSNV